jgi:hypothetical protein
VTKIKPHWKRKIYSPLFVLMIICCLSFALLFSFEAYQNQKIIADTLSWKERSQVAANPQDMEQDLGKCREGMKKWKITEGHDAIWIWQRPDNDMGLIMQSLDTLIIRSRELQKMDVTSTNYSTGLDDLRGTIRELDIHVHGWWVIRAFPLYVLHPILLIVSILLILFRWFTWDNKDQDEIAEEERQKKEKEELEEKETEKERLARETKYDKERAEREIRYEEEKKKIRQKYQEERERITNIEERNARDWEELNRPKNSEVKEDS